MLRAINRRHFTATALGLPATLALPSWAQNAAGGDRVALVIGNSSYPNAGLPNARNDAASISTALREMGFDVVLAQDASRAKMRTAFEELGRKLAGRNATALFYFAGHGLQLDWRNFLMPVDAAPSVAADVAASCIDIGEVLNIFTRARTKLNVVVLDACRNNPFADKATGKGLAQMDAPPSTILAYATAPGNVADDGPNGNGLYTAALLPELKKPEQKIEDIFKRTRFAVRRQSLGRQIPWESTSLEEDFYFLPPANLRRASEEDLKREIAIELAAWNKAKDATDAEPLIEFLRAYPSGRFTEFAQFRLDQISKPVVVAQPGKGEVAPPSPGSMRYRVGDHFVYEQVDSWERAPTRYDWPVTKADEHTAELANGQVIYTQLGAILRSHFGVFEPGSLVAPADISLGKRWKSAFRQTRSTPPIVEDVQYDFRAAAKESITVPAGKFDCFRVEGIGRAQGAGPTSTWTNSLEITFWIDVVSMISIERKLADPAIGQMGTTLTRNS